MSDATPEPRPIDSSIPPFVPADADGDVRSVLRTPWARRWALVVLMLMLAWTVVAWTLNARHFRERMDGTVGAATESEMKEKKMRVEDAMHATRAANQEGILPGGGVALLKASVALKPGNDLSDDEKAGYQIVVRACRSPITQIAANAGENGDVVANKVLETKDANYGYDARQDRYCDMVKEGIIDPTKVVRSALQNAASVATLLLTSDALVAELPKDEKKKAGGGGEDMY
jgi:chaperonin GroEL